MKAIMLSMRNRIRFRQSTSLGRKEKQEVAFALTIAEKLLNGRGACRVHGGGFAGTIQAFVPNDLLEEFKSGMESVLGESSCYVLSIRPQGGVEMEVE